MVYVRPLDSIPYTIKHKNKICRTFSWKDSGIDDADVDQVNKRSWDKNSTEFILKRKKRKSFNSQGPERILTVAIERTDKIRGKKSSQGKHRLKPLSKVVLGTGPQEKSN